MSYGYEAEIDFPNGYSFRYGIMYNQYDEVAAASSAGYAAFTQIENEINNAGSGPEFGMRTTNYSQSYEAQVASASSFRSDMISASEVLGTFNNVMAGDQNFVNETQITMSAIMTFAPDGSNVAISTFNVPQSTADTGVAQTNAVSEVVVVGAIAQTLEYNLIQEGAVEQTFYGQDGAPNIVQFVSATTHGSRSGASYDANTKLWQLPNNMTTDQVACVIFNEAQGISGPNSAAVMQGIADVLRNDTGDEQEAAAPFCTPQTAAQVQIYQEAYAIASSVNSQQDITNGATSFVMRPDSSTNPWRGLPDLLQIGPFNSAGTTMHYINFFKDPNI